MKPYRQDQKRSTRFDFVDTFGEARNVAPKRQSPGADYGHIGDLSGRVQEAVDVLYRGKWILIATFVLIAGAITWYNMQLIPEYESSAMLLVHPRQTDAREALPGGEQGLFARSDRSLANELIVIRNSLSIARSTAQRLIDTQTVPGSDERLPILGAGESTPKVQDIARRLQFGYVRIAPEGRDVDVLRVTALSPSPDEASLIANLYAEEYVRLTQEASRARVHASRSFLERQEEVRREELQLVEERITRYMSVNGAVALDAEGQFLVTQISQLQAARDEAGIDLQMEEASLASLESELERISPQLALRVASSVERDIELAQQKIAELEVTRQQAFLRNPSLRDDPAGDPRLADINQQIAQLRTSIAALSRQYVDEVLAVGGIDLTVEGGGLSQVSELNRQVVQARIRISGLRAKQDVMTNRLAEYEADLKTLPEQTIELAQLQRARQAAERMYVNVEEKLQEVRIAEESEIGYAAIIREALPPGYPVRPNRRKNVALGALFALGMGIVLATVRQRLDTKIYTPDDIRDRGGSVVGVIPKLNRVIKEQYGGAETTEHAGRTVSTRLVTLVQPTAVAAEAYRHVRTNIQFSRPDAIVQTILVTSPSPSEGKSVTALNIGVIMAQAGRKTLVIDADLRRPTVHHQLGLSREPGLIEQVFNETGERPPIDSVGIEHLFALPSGKTIANPAELLGSKRMREMIYRLREEYDVIVFDTPPVFMATDAVLLSTQCDATIIVALAGSTKTHEHDHCLNALTNVGANVIGTLLNQFEPISAGGYRYKYRYYAQYYNRYSYGYGQDEAANALPVPAVSA
ncbi:MAG: polysaccharide biosynthesis tyrosine autokinase [Rhodothermales bacterium]